MFALKKILTLVVCFGAPSLGAMNCKLAKTNEEKLVCSDKSLLKLDEILNEAYNAYMSLIRKRTGNCSDSSYCCTSPNQLIETQKYWVERNLSQNKKSVKAEDLKSAYQMRIAEFDFALGRISVTTKERRQEESTSSNRPVHYVWIEKWVGSNKLVQYPQVVIETFGKKAQHANDDLKEAADGAIKDMKSCVGSSLANVFDNFEFKVTLARANLFGVSFSDLTGGCMGGCAHPVDDLREEWLWDLETGDDISPTLESAVTFKEKYAKKFHDFLVKNNRAQYESLKENGSLDSECDYPDDDSFEDTEVKEFALESDHLSYNVNPSSARFNEACLARLVVPLQETAAWLAFDSEFLKLLPKLEASGRVTKHFAEQIRNASGSMKRNN
jgi:uncharacterized protein